MTFGSLFSGIGGFDLGFEKAGLQCRWQVENDISCQVILEKHWPDVKRFGDIREITGKEMEPVDVICGGFPCQDLSVAGRRVGLSAARSGLFYELLRIVSETRPRWFIIENVPGLLSSNQGRDMGAVIGSLAKLGYGIAWRVLDAQYFGVPQRRRRVFIAGHLGDIRSATEVLFESDECQVPVAKSRQKGDKVIDAIDSRAKNDSVISRTLTDSRKTRMLDVIDYILTDKGIRIFTHLERERLQGFPDGWTLPYCIDGLEVEITDTARYRLLGNAVAVPVAEWIGKRLKKGGDAISK